MVEDAPVDGDHELGEPFLAGVRQGGALEAERTDGGLAQTVEAVEVDAAEVRHEEEDSHFG